MRSRRGLVWVVLLALAAPSTGCRRHADAVAAEDASVVPPFTVRESSEGLLLTWIDEKGDFHVEQKTGDVPLVGRDAVRVVDPNREEGTHGDQVFVADLRVAGSDGAYPVRSMSREDFDAIAVARRQKSAPTLASPGTADAGDPAGGQGQTLAAGRPAVIIYGASWCGACHQAQAYLKKRGITFIEKDIEEDPKAAAEMQSKLRRAGKAGGSIPVLDVRGRILVGFDPRSVEEALGSPI